VIFTDVAGVPIQPGDWLEIVSCEWQETGRGSQPFAAGQLIAPVQLAPAEGGTIYATLANRDVVRGTFRLHNRNSDQLKADTGPRRAVVVERKDSNPKDAFGSRKDSNPKDAFGSRKVPLHMIPKQVLAGIALGMLEGACKYGAFNYRAVGVRCSTYLAAARRHLDAFEEGQDIDPESGLHHIDKALSSLVVMRDAMLNDMCEDDRPPAVTRANWMDRANELAGDILDRFARKAESFTEKNRAEWPGIVERNRAVNPGPRIVETAGKGAIK